MIVTLTTVVPTPAIELPAMDGVRATAGGYLDGLAVVGTDDGRRQRPQAVGNLKLEARRAR